MEETDFIALHRTKNKSGAFNLKPLTGKLIYDKGFREEMLGIDYDAWLQEGEVAKEAGEYGLPSVVYGNPALGCGCSEAHLHAIGKVKDGQIELDYMCDSGWHNYMVFRVKTKEEKAAKEVKYDKFGNVTADTGFTAQDLSEM